ncbi:MAG TPA: DUF1800 domain-containing protein [Longimicrobiales bacterium]
MDLALHALNRFGLGAAIGERGRLRDPRGWLLEQLGSSVPPVEGGAGEAEVRDALRALRAAQASSDPAAAMAARRRVIGLAGREMTAVLERRLTTAQPFLERLVAFWSNHLCVSAAGKVVVAPLAGLYERAAIRPHVLGRFEDMVLASARHPAMLLYLDNAQSIGPSSRAARAGERVRRGSQRGLNENYARELLELHTLGVHGGYAQQDVQELARILTGWTVSGLPGARRPGGAAGDDLGFRFEPLLHEPGAKTLLGVRYGEGGEEEGRRAIRALCAHPSTARFVATKLVRHFVADDPPASAVAAVERAFRESDGDLRAVTRALVEHPESWSDAHRKFRTPQDWLVAVMRALDVERAGENVPVLLRQLRQPLWAPPAPNGFADTLEQWADPDSLLNRAELARTISRRVPRSFDPRLLLDVIDLPSSDPLHALLADTAVAVTDRVALAIAAPAFQWR